jgi:uncharacterized protein (DUF2141 family)
MAMPTGGNKDVNAPEVISDGTIPKNASVQFSSNRIYIEFDEYIKLQPGKQPVVSPPIMPVPELLVKGKKLIINLKSPLQPNTTYTIHFPAMIADITENNTIENFSYVFSTGNYLDTGMVLGKVINASNHMPFAKAWVLLYNDTVQRAMKGSLPAGLAKTMKDGSFKIENVKPGSYFITALSDLNNNLRYDLPGEWTGFSDSAVMVETSAEIKSIMIFKSCESKLKVANDITVSPLLHKIIFNKPINQMRINAVNQSQNFKEYYVLPGDSSVYLSFNNRVADTAWFKLESNELNADTFYILPDRNKEFKYKTQTPSDVYFLPGEHPVLQVNAWSTWNNNQVQVFDTVSKQMVQPVEWVSGIFPGLKLNENPEACYRITLNKGALTSATGELSDSLGFYARWLPEEKYGKIELTYNFSNYSGKGKAVVELFRASPVFSDTVHVNNLSGKIIFPFVRAGNYVLRAFIDENGDGRWTTGDFEKKSQPEPAFINGQQVQVRAGWELELNWKTE